MSGERSRGAALAAMAFGALLSIGVTVWPACGRADRYQEPVQPAVVGGAVVPAVTASAGAAVVPPPADVIDEWTAFLQTIHQPAPTAAAAPMPAHQRVIGITSDADAGGAPALKLLVLDLGDLSVHAVDPPTP
jgi:hypothetical protein